jgi:diacylglycerol kinase family enzyme
MRRLLLMANPAASGFTAMLHRAVVATLRPHFEVTPVWPDDPLQAEAEAAAAAAAGVDVVVAMGGDGIVHRVANGIAGTRSCLAVIPAGTSNVFARITGHPRRGTTAAEAIVAASQVVELSTLRIDATGPGVAIGRVAVFAAGLGYDAAVIRESERRPLGKVGAGTIHYTRSSLRVAFAGYRNRHPDISVTVDGAASRAATVIVQVHDQLTFLGRRALTLSPEGGPAAVAIQRTTPWRLLQVVTAAARHRHPGKVPGVAVWHPFEHLEATADGVTGLEADGEYRGEIAHMTLKVMPASLRLLVPGAVR